MIGAVRARARIKTLLGLGLGVAGVSILVGFDVSTVRPDAALAITAALLAAFCYGIATQFTQSSRLAKEVTPFANAQGCTVAATLMIAPCMGFVRPLLAIDANVAVAVLMLGIVCSGMAYLLYFQLIDDLGATSALTVTFLIPVFGVAWGALFLGEAVVWQTVLGGALVIFSTTVVTGFSISSLKRPKS